MITSPNYCISMLITCVSRFMIAIKGLYTKNTILDACFFITIIHLRCQGIHHDQTISERHLTLREAIVERTRIYPFPPSSEDKRNTQQAWTSNFRSYVSHPIKESSF